MRLCLQLEIGYWIPRHPALPFPGIRVSACADQAITIDGLVRRSAGITNLLDPKGFQYGSQH